MTIQVTRTQISCGVRQIWNIDYDWSASSFYKRNPEKFILEFWSGSLDPEWKRRFAFAIFSHNHHGFSDCDFISKYITEQKLGTVSVSETLVNPNSGNRIKVYMWTIDWIAVEAFVKKYEEPKVWARQVV